jgi:LysM repeat protein
MKKLVLKAMATVLLLGVAGSAYSASCAKGMCTVQKGDTLGSIGKQLKVDWRILAEINEIKNVNKIMAGQKIRYIR